MGFKELYPPAEPYDHGMLAVGDGNEIYWETCGNPDGAPVVFVHGGPGGGVLPGFRRYFDPAAYRIVLFDQRNCGRSLPHASGLDVAWEANTTPHLAADMEALREHLGIERWLVFGGSWGTTLGLAYGQAHPERVTGFVLRGVYLARPEDEAWTFSPTGLARLFPDEWAPFHGHVPEAERDDLVSAYGRRLFDPDPAVHLAAAKAWLGWELSANTLVPAPPPTELDDRLLVAMARIQQHYVGHDSFLGDGLLAGVDRIRHLPAVIVHGRYDMKCPIEQAWALHLAWPEAEFHIVEDAGHASTEPGTLHHIIEATDRFRP